MLGRRKAGAGPLRRRH